MLTAYLKMNKENISLLHIFHLFTASPGLSKRSPDTSANCCAHFQGLLAVLAKNSFRMFITFLMPRASRELLQQYYESKKPSLEQQPA